MVTASAGGKDRRVLAAAMVHQIGDGAAKACGIDAVDHVPGHPARGQKTCLFQCRKVKRQPGPRQPKGLRNLSGGHTCSTLRHQQTNKVKPGFVRKGRQGCEGFTSIHRSTIQEMLK